MAKKAKPDIVIVVPERQWKTTVPACLKLAVIDAKTVDDGLTIARRTESEPQWSTAERREIRGWIEIVTPPPKLRGFVRVSRKGNGDGLGYVATAERSHDQGKTWEWAATFGEQNPVDRDQAVEYLTRTYKIPAGSITFVDPPGKQIGGYQVRLHFNHKGETEVREISARTPAEAIRNGGLMAHVSLVEVLRPITKEAWVAAHGRRRTR